MEYNSFARPKIPRNKYGYTGMADNGYFGSRAIGSGVSGSGSGSGKTYSPYINCEENKDGAEGLVPAPGASQQRFVLTGGSYWTDLHQWIDSSNGKLCVDTSINAQKGLEVNGSLSVDGQTNLNNTLDLSRHTLNNVGVSHFYNTAYFHTNVYTYNAYPFANKTYNLGSDSLRWNNIYGQTAYIDTANFKVENSSVSNTSTLTAENAEIHNLTVSGTAHFFNLMIDEVKAAGGQIILSPGDFHIDATPIIYTFNPSDMPSIINQRLNPSDNAIYRVRRCLMKATDDDGHRIQNKWTAGDFAFCQTFNLSAEGGYLDNKYYWTIVGDCGYTFDDNFIYIDLIESCTGVDDYGAYRIYFDPDGDFNPEMGDDIVMLGSWNEANQNAIILSAYKSPDTTVKAPSIVQYKGINNIEQIGKFIYNKIAANGNLFRGDLRVEGGQSINDIIDEINQQGKMYVHTAYANSANGQVDFSKTNSGTTSYKYIGFCVSLLSSDSTLTYTDYTWSYVGFEDTPVYKLVPRQCRAYVNNDVLYRYFYVDAYEILGTTKKDLYTTNHTVSVYYVSNTVSTAYNLSHSTAGYYYHGGSMTNFSKTTAKPEYYIIYLSVDGEVVDRYTVNVEMLPSAVLSITDNITARVVDVSSNVLEIEARADGIDVAIQSLENDTTQLKADTSGLKTTVQNHGGRLSTVEQTADRISTRVSNLYNKGVNILMDSDFEMPLKDISLARPFGWFVFQPHSFRRDIPDNYGNCANVLSYSNINHNIIPSGGYYAFLYQRLDGKLKAGTWYTFSFWCSGQGSFNTLFYKNDSDDAWRLADTNYPFIVDGAFENANNTCSHSWQSPNLTKHTFTFKTRDDLSVADKVNFELRVYDNATTWFDVKCLCLEEGTIASEWENASRPYSRPNMFVRSRLESGNEIFWAPFGTLGGYGKSGNILPLQSCRTATMKRDAVSIRQEEWTQYGNRNDVVWRYQDWLAQSVGGIKKDTYYTLSYYFFPLVSYINTSNVELINHFYNVKQSSENGYLLTDDVDCYVYLDGECVYNGTQAPDGKIIIPRNKLNYSKWNRVEIVYKTSNKWSDEGENKVLWRCAISDNQTAAPDMYVCAPKLEEGFRATAYEETDYLESLITQTATDIQLQVNNLTTGLMSAGITIDGENSKIDMTGSVELHDNGDDKVDTLKVFDADENCRVTITPEGLPKIGEIASVPQYKYVSNQRVVANLPYYSTSGNRRTYMTNSNAVATGFIPLGNYKAGQQIKLTPNGSPYVITKGVYDPDLSIASRFNYGVESFTAASSNNVFTIVSTPYNSSGMVPTTNKVFQNIPSGTKTTYTITEDAHYAVRIQIPISSRAWVEPKSGNGLMLDSMRVEAHIAYPTVQLESEKESQTIIAKDGIAFAGGLVSAYFSKNSIELNNNCLTKFSENGVFVNLNPTKDTYGDYQYGRIGSTMAVRTITANGTTNITYDDDFVILSAGSPSSISLPYSCPTGKMIIIKNLSGGSRTLSSLSSYPIYDVSSTNGTTSISMSNGQTWQLIYSGTNGHENSTSSTSGHWYVISKS